MAPATGPTEQRPLIERVWATRDQTLLRQAMNVPALYHEALVVKGVLAMEARQPRLALIPLVLAAHHFKNRTDLQVLLVQALMDCGDKALAQRVISDRLNRFPEDPALWRCYNTVTGRSATVFESSEVVDSSMPVPQQLSEFALASSAQREATVDILVPVYNGFEATLRCIESLVRYRNANQTPHEIVVLDDAGPEISLPQRLQEMANAGLITYVRRPVNLGFIANMNRGMALHAGRDVVWLNSDTRVHGDWLDRLHRAAYSQDRVASVTPFSNNGLVMSIPEPFQWAAMPSEAEQNALDQLAGLLGYPPVEIPSGCGFCLYLRRDAIDEVGYLDEVHLKRGYEEETDWCLRAVAKGWKNLGATNLYVAHEGGVSFGLEKALRVQQNGKLIRRRYPTAQLRLRRFRVNDPLRPARDALLKCFFSANTEESPRARISVEALLANTEPSCWLIGDDMADSSMGSRWLEVARRVAQAGVSCNLILAQPTPWEVGLTRTGVVSTLASTTGLTREEVLRLSAPRACLSLGKPEPTVSAFARRGGILSYTLQ